MKCFGYILAGLLSFSQSFGQKICGTSAYAVKMNDGMVNRENSQSISSALARDTAANEIITIPVVIHILFNTVHQNISDAQVLSQLKVLNEDYRRLNADAVNTPAAFRSVAADARIMFCLAQVDPQGRPTKGIIRKYTTATSFQSEDRMKFTAAGGDDAWDSKKYLNIWVCNLFGRSLGYATPPGGQADKDGVVINFDVFGTVGNLRAPFTKGRTATHEVGHWLGLRHLWGDESCGSDEVDDTPQQTNYNFNCPSFPHVSSCSPNANGDMFMNFMDFTDDACMNMFTNGQKKKMRSLFALNASRNSFLNSFACDSSLATGAPVPDDTIPVVKPAPSIQVYPNPVQQFLSIKGLNGYMLEGKSVTVFSSAGVKKVQRTLVSENDKINLSALPSGIYFLVVGDGANRRTLKLVKQ
jgi:hypothetical protein